MQGPLQLPTNCTHEQLPITLIPMCACACVCVRIVWYLRMYVCMFSEAASGTWSWKFRSTRNGWGTTIILLQKAKIGVTRALNGNVWPNLPAQFGAGKKPPLSMKNLQRRAEGDAGWGLYCPPSRVSDPGIRHKALSEFLEMFYICGQLCFGGMLFPWFCFVAIIHTLFRAPAP